VCAEAVDHEESIHISGVRGLGLIFSRVRLTGTMNHHGAGLLVIGVAVRQLVHSLMGKSQEDGDITKRVPLTG